MIIRHPAIWSTHYPTKAFSWKIRCSPKIKHFFWQYQDASLERKILRLQVYKATPSMHALERRRNQIFMFSLVSTSSPNMGYLKDPIDPKIFSCTIGLC